ncbi:hypothetical protein [Deinococcus sedimenti]|uniref:Uncharacterized protein n=1 Tax=Deinococcus sedimenti TaxID=1867090 RepID=A0ABQ2S9K4_9DEIO|nr:hypothetical protein [Deinococcus sedimenti]GGS11217.1 hypothetical protein GCM10008960_41520 [Deinococcus sedimenti]
MKPGLALAALLTLSLSQASAAALIDVSKAAGKSPAQIKALLRGWRAEQLRADLLGGRPGSEWRYTNAAGYVLEVTHEGQKADKFVLMGDPIHALNPARDYQKVLALLGLTGVPKSTNIYGPSHSWYDFRGFSQVSVAGNGPKITWVIVKKTPTK